MGDRIRMNAINDERVFMRSLATRQAHRALSAHIEISIDICQAAGFGLIIVESSGIGQADALIHPAYKDGGFLDTAVVQLRFDNGAFAVAEASFQAVYGYDVRGEVFGSNGVLLAGRAPEHGSPGNTSPSFFRRL